MHGKRQTYQLRWRRFRFCIQHVADLRREFAEAEGLDDQLHTLVEPTVMDDGVARISGCEQHLEGGTKRLRLCRNLRASESPG